MAGRYQRRNEKSENSVHRKINVLSGTKKPEQKCCCQFNEAKTILLQGKITAFRVILKNARYDVTKL
jgi:hypothetical protein